VHINWKAAGRAAVGDGKQRERGLVKKENGVASSDSTRERKKGSPVGNIAVLF
jgi:hypothetical protein